MESSQDWAGMTAAWQRYHPWPASDPVNDPSGDIVQLSDAFDSSKLRSVLILAEDAYGKGIEWYAHYKLDERP